MRAKQEKILHNKKQKVFGAEILLQIIPGQP